MKSERRSLTQEFRVSEDAQPTITGYAAVFNSPTDVAGMWTEEVDPHAFDKVLASNPDVRSMFNHDPHFVLGRTTAGTLKLGVDSRGLSYSVTPPPTQWANDLMVSMRRGDISGSSFGFVCNRDEWRQNDDGSVSRRILEVSDLLDASPVTFPAYEDTSAQVRSAFPESMPVELRSKLEVRADQKKTKRVDGEDLTSECFLIVGDPKDTSTWHLPWKFSTEEKTQSHLRDALARFDQVEGVSAEDMKAAKEKLMRLCREHGIEVSEEKSSWLADAELRLRLEEAL